MTAGYQSDFLGVPSMLGMMPVNGPAAFPNLLYLPSPLVERSESFRSLVGRAVADYAINDDLTGYASISRGRRPNVVNVDALSSEIIDDEIVISGELGLKGAFDGGRFVYDVAAYRYEYSNFQTTVRDDDSLRYVRANGGNATAWGAELSMSWRASDRLSAFLNYGYIDASFDDTDDDGNVQAARVVARGDVDRLQRARRCRRHQALGDGGHRHDDGVVVVGRHALVHRCRKVVARSVGSDPGAFLGSLG